jgi:hypothetical protein
MKTKILLVLLSIACNLAFSQSVTISPGSLENPAMIDVSNSQMKGFKLPVMGILERLGIENPTDGFTVFDYDKKGLCTYYSSAWYCSSKDTLKENLNSQLVFAADSTANDYFGHAVAIAGTESVIGAAQAEVGTNTNQGAVYIFSYDANTKTWSQVQKLTAADGVDNDNFGASVALRDNYLIIGAPGVSSNKGAVYVYRKISGVWTQDAKILASDGLAGDRFGITVDFRINSGVPTTPVVAIGASGYDKPVGGGGSTLADFGSSYVYSRGSSNWTLQQKIVESSGSEDDGTGMIVRFKDGALLVIAKPNANTIQPTGRYGKIYTYKKSLSWASIQTLSGTANERIGEDIAIDGSFMVSGSGVTQTVKIYKISGDVWSTSNIAVLNSPYMGIAFGASVAISANKVLVRDTGSNYGLIYKCISTTNNTWVAAEVIPFQDFCAYNNTDGHITAMGNGLFVAGEGSTSCTGSATRIVFGEYSNN